MSFGQIIKELRQRHGWSQEELAFRAGSTAATISRIETGKHGAVDQLKAALAGAFDLRLSELIALAESEPPPKLVQMPESDEERLMALFDRMSPEKRGLFLAIAKAFVNSR
jgi:transcriptional regulator with XRE-family HTH domain